MSLKGSEMDLHKSVSTLGRQCATLRTVVGTQVIQAQIIVRLSGAVAGVSQ